MLKGKTALVTGGSRGIGAAIAQAMAAEGADVIVVYAGDAQAAERVCQTCREAYGVRAQAYRCDVSDFAAVKELAAQVKADWGGIQILVNNAGITRDGLVMRMKEEDFDRVMDTNLKGAFNMIRHFSPMLMRQEESRIINISSISGVIGNAGQANYAASKAGLIGLTKTVARELASRRVTCNAIAPGFIETYMTRAMPVDAQTLAAAVPLGRMGKPEEVAQAAVFLANAAYVTGEVLCVSGGIGM